VTFLGAVNLSQADTLCFAIVHNFNGIAIDDFDEFSGEKCGLWIGRKKQ
jgi:hypothetical protein